MEVLILLIFWLIMAFIVYMCAKHREKPDPIIWGFMGFLFGIFALIVLFFTRNDREENFKLEKRRELRKYKEHGKKYKNEQINCPYCDELISRHAKKCKHCGEFILGFKNSNNIVEFE